MEAKEEKNHELKPPKEQSQSKLKHNAEETKLLRKDRNKTWQWKNFPMMEKTQIILSVTSVLTVLAYILVSTWQLHQTSESLERADSSNTYTRKSVELQLSAWKYQKVRDSLNAIDQFKKDSALVHSQRERDSLGRAAFIYENRAYVVFHNFEPFSFNFHGGTTNIHLWIKNVGKTPAQKEMHYTFLSLSEDSLEKFVHLGENFLERHKQEGNILGGGDSVAIIYHSAKFTKTDSISWVIKPPKIYYGGILSYTDIFNVHHVTYFCFESTYGKNEVRTFRKYNEIK